jgi:hypothetical protein
MLPSKIYSLSYTQISHKERKKWGEKLLKQNRDIISIPVVKNMLFSANFGDFSMTCEKSRYNM